MVLFTDLSVRSLTLLILCLHLVMWPLQAMAADFTVAWDLGWRQQMGGTLYLNIGTGPGNVGSTLLPLTTNHTNEEIKATGYRTFSLTPGETVHIALVHDFPSGPKMMRDVYYRTFVMPTEGNP